MLKQNYYFECFDCKDSDRIRAFKTRHEMKRYALKDKVLANPNARQTPAKLGKKFISNILLVQYLNGKPGILVLYASCCHLKCNGKIIWWIFFDPDDVKVFGGSI